MKKVNIHTYTRHQYFLLILGACLVSFVVTGCSALMRRQETRITPTLAPTPEYLLLVTPIRSISLSAYDDSRSSSLVLARGIAVSIWTSRMDVAEKNRKWEIIKDRVALYVDGKQVSSDTLIGGPDGEKGGGLFRLSWAPNLSTGLHKATFKFTTDGGDVLEYSWQFGIE